MIDNVNVSRDTIDLINDWIFTEESNGCIFPKAFLTRCVYFLHLVKKGKATSIPKQAEDVFTNNSEKAYFKQGLIKLGIFTLVKNYSTITKMKAVYICNLDPMDYCNVSVGKYADIGKQIEAIQTRKKKIAIKYADKFNYGKGIKIDISEKLEKRRKLSKFAIDQESELKQIEVQAKIAENINNGIFGFHRKKTGERRLYSIIASLESEYRKELTDAEGNPLVEIDVRSSHPMILQNAFDAFLRYYEEIESLKKAKKVVNHKGFTPLDIVGIRSELGTWAELCQGDIYQTIATATGATRKAIKKTLLAYLNDYHSAMWLNEESISLEEEIFGFDDSGSSFGGKKVKSYRNKHIYNWFKENLPKLNGLIQYLHTVERNNTIVTKVGNEVIYSRGPKAFKYSISEMLMNYEANVILDQVCLTARKSIPNNIIVSVHDSILTEQKNMDYVASLMNERYRALGINVTLVNEFKNSVALTEQKQDFPDISLTPNSTSTQPNPDNPQHPTQQIQGDMSGNLILNGTNQPLNGTRERENSVSVLKDGRFRLSVKDIKYNSRKGETIDDFKKRLTLLGVILDL